MSDRTDGPPAPSALGALVAAVEFYTRVPRPATVPFHAQDARRSVAFVPLVGAGVGAVVGLVYLGAVQLLPAMPSVVIALAFGAWFTGALHEDGFADVCDAFGAIADRERTLEILKDPRCGAYAVIGLVLLMLAKVAALVSIAENGSSVAVAGALVAAHAVSRFAAISVMTRLPYARAGGADARSTDFAHAPRTVDALCAAAFAVVAAVLLPLLGLTMALASFIVVLLAVVWLMRLFHRRIGGYTGDCLGTVQQVSELIILLGAAAAV